MRVKVKKMLFMGSHDAVNGFFECAQKIGWFQFSSNVKKGPHVLPKEIEDLKMALKELKKLEVSHAQVAVSFYEIPNIVKRILILKQEIADVHEKIRHVKAEIVKMHPMGNFDIELLQQIEDKTGRAFRFYFTRHDRFTAEEIPEDLIFINREYDFDYYLRISKDEFHKSGFIEIPIQKSLSDWTEELSRLEALSHNLDVELREMANYQECLEDYCIDEMNKINLNFSKEEVDFCFNDNLFIIEAWVPSNKLDQVERVTKDLAVIYKEVAPEKDEKIPTYLDNKGLSEIGQDLIEIYDTPSHSEADPSRWVIWFFAIFFGMIISDAGYGVIFLLVSLYLWTKYKKIRSPLGKRMVKLLTLLSCVTIVWGVMVASYFSIKLEPNSNLNKFSILHYLAVKKIDYHVKLDDKVYQEWMHNYPEISNSLVPETILAVTKHTKEGHPKYVIMDQIYDSLLMEIALLVGIIHLSLSFLRKLRGHWAGLGWVFALFGGYFYFSTVVDAVPMVNYLGLMSPKIMKIVGEQLLFGGLGLALVLGLIQDKLGGLAQIFKTIEVFADTLSYLRLYALGLASMVLASTFNEMGMAAGYVGGALIILFGHLINIVLGVSAGVIHGLRLNLLEWYHHCFEGGGTKFKPLKLILRD